MKKKQKVIFSRMFQKIVNKAIEEAAKKYVTEPKPWFDSKTIFQGIVAGVLLLVLIALFKLFVLS